MKRILVGLIALAVGQVALAVELETFTAKGNPKTLGVDFKIGHPKDWQVRPDYPGTGVAAFWSTPAGPGDSMMLIVPAQNLPKDNMTKEAYKPFFMDPRMSQIIVGRMPGANFLQKVFLDDSKYPAGFLDYTLALKTPEGGATVKVRNYIVYLGRVMLQVQFYYVQDAGPDQLEKHAAGMKQVFESLELLAPAT